MSMNTYVVGFVPPDEKFKKMKQIWDNCTEFNLEIPIEVDRFFDQCEPNDNGMEVKIPSNEWSDGDMEAGLEININDIPDNVKIIRFYNSW